MTPRFFAKPAQFRKWLEKNHEKETELLVGYYKVDSGKPSMSWPESVDEALCFGWIDGVRRRIDDDSYSIRFTPRKPGSIWSVINIRKMEELARKGLVWPAGTAAFEKKKDHKSAIYSYEKEPAKLLPEFEKRLKANKKAWKYFSSQPPSYRNVVIHWVMTARQEKTRLSRMETLIADCEAGQKIKSQRYR